MRRLPNVSIGAVARTVLCAMATGACDDVSPRVDDACPIPPPARVLVEQIVVRSLVDILTATEHASEAERAIALSLPGRNFSFTAYAFLAREGRCVGPEARWFMPFCQSQFSEIDGSPPANDAFSMTYDSCSRLGCESTRVGLVDVYLTVRPRRAPDDRHAFEYETTDPIGRMRFDPNPYVTYRVDLTDPFVTTVSAQLRHRLTFTPAVGPPFDLSYTGTAMALKQGFRIQSASLLVFFTGFTPGFPVMLSLEHDARGDVQGSARVGDRVLATIDGHFDPRVSLFSWQGTCDPRNPAATAGSPIAPSGVYFR